MCRPVRAISDRVRAPRAAALATSAALLLVLAGWAGAAPRALADGDPASDVLLAQSVFYPYQPPVPAKLEAALNGLLRASAHAHMPLKVAIVGAREELGLETRFWLRPQAYADFLDREISFNSPEPLLVVLPDGFGLAHAGPATALAGVKIDAGERTYGLVRAAILAVEALDRAGGHPIAAPAIPTDSGGGGGPPSALLFGLPALLLVAIAAVPALRRRRPAD